ncbi:MAG: hypothetical protein WC199_10855 [Dysgonamonadaceae bacterium]
MKKYLFLVATLLLTMSMSVSAQNNRRNFDNGRSDNIMRMSPKERVDLMTKELNLTTEEAADVLALCEKQEAERNEQVTEHRSERGMGPQNRDTRRREFREMREKQMEEHYAELEKIIGKERADKWYDLRQDVRDYNRAGRMYGRGYYRYNRGRGNGYYRRNLDNRRSDYIMRMLPKERVDLMTRELDLTTEQAAQILALSEKQEAKRREQVAEQREGRGLGSQNRDARRDEFREMREKQMEEYYAELEKIIGKEKADKWYELRKDVRDYNRAGRRNPRNWNW